MPVVTLNYTNSIIKDSYVDEVNPTTTQGLSGTVSIYVDSALKRVRGLLFFDLGLIPNDAIINSATLNLRKVVSTAVGVQIGIHKLTNNIAIDSATWSGNAPAFDPSASANFSTVATAGAMSANVKNLVQDWVNGNSPNFGMLLKASSESAMLDGNHGFASNEHATTLYRPTLTVDYTLPTTGKKQVEYVGKGTVGSGSGNSLTVPFHASTVAGDLVVVHGQVNILNTISFPSGWTIAHHSSYNGYRVFTAYRTVTQGQTSVPLSADGSPSWSAVAYTFRNVKAMVKFVTGAAASTTGWNPPPITVTQEKTLILVLNAQQGSSVAVTHPLNYSAIGVSDGSGGRLSASMHYMYNDLDQLATEMTTTFGSAVPVGSTALALEPLSNNPPTLTLTSPTDNQTLTEGNKLPVEGSATDLDVNDPVTFYVQVNNGTPVAVHSDVSNGSTAISFAKQLEYRNKRIYYGTTDLAGADLAENTDHALKVWAEDNKQGKSAVVTRQFRVIWNRPPVIDGSDSPLGALNTPPSINYKVTEPEGDSFTITELLNGQQIRSFAGVAGQQNTATIDQDRWLRLALGVQHELRIRATDSKGQFSDRIYTFTRTETQIQFDLKNPFFCDAKPTRVLVTLDGTFPDASTVLVEVCNNAYDTVPAYEDATGPSLAGRGYIFTNETKTAADWGINIRITINKGTATEKVILNGFGGAFD